ncbi:MAG: SOS response-associated peptidase [Pseudomonas piscis]|uniref:SOS response-associated peptidase n=1 Tax=Pseudomonas piscis TaxID=2614538 RepID=UPI003D2A4882
MCSHYEAPSPTQVADVFGGEPYQQGKLDLWPGYVGPFIRRSADPGSAHQVLIGTFGLIPSWSKDNKIVRYTYNARSETVAEKPSFRNAWRRGQHCIIPAVAIYEPDWRTGKAIATRICRADGEIMGIAGLWEQWQSPDTGLLMHSYTMLTVNADEHAFMRNYHRPEDEKRMVVILPPESYNNWLDAGPGAGRRFMQQLPDNQLIVDG